MLEKNFHLLIIDSRNSKIARFLAFYVTRLRNFYFTLYFLPIEECTIMNDDELLQSSIIHLESIIREI